MPHQGYMKLDDGEQLYVHGLKSFQRALAALRKSKPGIVIDSKEKPAFCRLARRRMPDYLSHETAADRPSSWLPGGDTKWMTPLERAGFEKSGGRVSFSGATFPDRKGKRLLTVEF
jgi:hypothetical protein